MGTAVVGTSYPLESLPSHGLLASPAHTVGSPVRPTVAPGKPGAWAGPWGVPELRQLMVVEGNKGSNHRRKPESQVQRALGGKGGHKRRNRAPSWIKAKAKVFKALCPVVL